MIIPYISKWPQALAIMTLPPNVPAALANVLTLVDDICYYAGDRSVDVSYSTAIHDSTDSHLYCAQKFGFCM
jgi:ubiquinone biosynthesis protein COQ9